MKCPIWLSKIHANNDALLPFALAIWQFGMAMWLFSRTQDAALKNAALNWVNFTLTLCLSLMAFGLGVFTVARRFRPRPVSDFRKI